MINVKRVVYALVIVFISISTSFSQEVRNSDGFGNNKLQPEMGTAGSMLKILTSNGYTDKISSPAAPDRMNPRIISNILFDQNEIISDSRSLSDYNWVFGQFIDHDVTLVENAHRTDRHEGLVIVPPLNDEFFAPGNMIFMMRSQAAEGTGTSIENPRRHNNEITSFIDGSGIYGSDDERLHWLRTYADGKKVTVTNRLQCCHGYERMRGTSGCQKGKTDNCQFKSLKKHFKYNFDCAILRCFLISCHWS